MSTSHDNDLLVAADETFRTLNESLGPDERSWLERVPLARAIEAVDAHPVGARVTYRNPALRAVADEVEQLGGEAWLDRYLRLLLLALLIRTLGQPVPYELPPSVDALLGAQRRRIVNSSRAPSKRRYKLGGAFARDRGFCLGTALPFGLVVGHVDASIPRETLVRGGLGHLQETPWLNHHLDVGTEGRHYTAEAREFSTHRTADFLRYNPAYQGIFGVGWLSDPALQDISPHLTQPRNELLDAGAVVLPLDTADDETVRLATAASTSRRRLHGEGRYTPSEFMMVVPREGVLRWSAEALQSRALRL